MDPYWAVFGSLPYFRLKLFYFRLGQILRILCGGLNFRLSFSLWIFLLFACIIPTSKTTLVTDSSTFDLLYIRAPFS